MAGGKVDKGNIERKKPVLIVLGLLLLVLLPLDLIGGHLMGTYLSDELNSKNDGDLEGLLGDLKTSINMHLVVLDSLEAFMYSGDPDSILDNHLDNFTTVIMEKTPAIEGCIVLKESGELHGSLRNTNVDFDNWQLLASGFPDVLEGIQTMREERREVMMGPFLFNGDFPILVEAKPFYVEDSLWGFTSVVVNLTDIFREHGLLDDDFGFEVQFINPKGVTFFGSEVKNSLSTIEKDLDINDAVWKIRARSKTNWFEESSAIIITFLIGELVITILISTIVYVTASQQINLNSLVGQRTTELKERSKSLTEEVSIRKISQRKLFEANRQLEDSLREVNCLLEVSQLQLEGKTRLEDVLIRASEILDRSMLKQKKMSSRIRVNEGEHMAFPMEGKVVYGSGIHTKGKVTGYIEVLHQEVPQVQELDETEKKTVDSVATIIGMIRGRWRAERREEDAKKEAQFYLDLMSHDINNLHQGILVNLQLIEKGMIQGAMITKVVGNSADLVRRSINLVRNVKLLSVMKDYEKPLTTIDLGSSMEEAANEVKLAFPKREVKVSIKLPEEGIKILADKVVEEVFINIINNAVKVQEKDPAIVEVESRTIKDKVLISISDHGPGINDNDKGNLFERHNKSIKDKSLSGLGLSLVKVLMDRYGGRVWISDRVEGDHTRGACFNLVFKRLNS